jgi:hypothetical protein
VNRVVAAQMGLDSGREVWDSCRGETERTHCHRLALLLPLPFFLLSCSPPLRIDAVHVVLQSPAAACNDSSIVSCVDLPGHYSCGVLVRHPICSEGEFTQLVVSERESLSLSES